MLPDDSDRRDDCGRQRMALERQGDVVAGEQSCGSMKPLLCLVCRLFQLDANVS